ncbi:hypothetical protein AZE42_11173 [Rhizopogon vesiculosus]|uniref:Uncharacterized protein n=1 Tax=Rhizopogon vesiculosus TaxID=180088 RepID=A0A1J8QTD3_9AGAM|nr:hypothetical protein AZE42_11173 [Rhizopogon vesiculosus]
MTRSKGVALVTGSAQGIGSAIATRLARDGFDVALNDLPAKNAVLEDLAAELRRGEESEGSYSPRTCIVVGDVSKEDEVKRMIDTVVDELGSLDVMVANAGIAELADILTETVENWERIMTVNVTSTFLCYKYSAMQMVKQGRGGRIIGASSVVGKQDTVTQAQLPLRDLKIAQYVKLPPRAAFTAQILGTLLGAVLTFVAFFLQWRLRTRHPRWFVKCNYIVAAALDRGAQVMVFILSFTVQGAGGTSHLFPEWWGANQGGNYDHCDILN